MKLFGWTLTREKTEQKALQPIYGHGGWWSLIREPFAGAWQRNICIKHRDTVLTYSAVFACITLIANDIAKLRLRLVKQDDDGIWQEVEANSPFWPVLRRPNRYSNRIQFIAQWITVEAGLRQHLRAQGARRARRCNRTLPPEPSAGDGCW